MKKFRKYIFVLILALVIALVSNYTYTFAKYVYNAAWDYYLKSNGFYFNSDYLDTDTYKNVNSSWNGESISFNIRNNQDQTVITDYDIKYKVECSIKGEASLHTKCTLNGSNSNTANGTLSAYQRCINNKDDGVDVSNFNKKDCEIGGYYWEKEIAVKDLYFDIVVTDENYQISDITVNISVTSTSPYRKTLNGDFILHKNAAKENSIGTDYSDYPNYGRLVIANNYSFDKCVKIKWNADRLLIDEDVSNFRSYQTDGNDYINQVVVNIGRKESLSYLFYKKNFNAVYSISEFTVEESNNCE